MTPILIGPEVCAETLKGASARLKTAHPSSHGRAALLVLFMSFLPFLPQEFSAAALRGAYHEFTAQVIGMSAGLQTSGTTWNSRSSGVCSAETKTRHVVFAGCANVVSWEWARVVLARV